MRHDCLYLDDIVEAADHIAQFMAGVDFEAFQKSEMLRSAVMQKLGIIGEAAGHISQEPATCYASGAVAANFGIDWEVVWRAATNRCPVLRAQVGGIVASEFGGPAKGSE